MAELERPSSASPHSIADRVFHAVRRLVTSLLPLALVALALTPGSASATNVKFVGTAGYTYVGNVAVLTANEVANFSPSGFSGTLRLELWALPTPYAGSFEAGYQAG
jgi:hypothetical protein